ncbi:hypothetical protein OIE13_22750 [Streptosporangium sp. NBC_01810]|uniref:hypothetical protein n=1 Tax=Streptosporangium sp. NBC_01810 TaxID=2975951 RepID=UPI002DD98A03|nr:hypothetical protein [Streptosporangium sp. NBC_01810]WSA23765.1 hypothetical protein OIE13_22750 [Streptosporangium sp. NBC_01810]
MNHDEDAMSAYLAREWPPIVSLPDPVTDPVERYERLIEWADDRHDYDDQGDDQQ